MPRCFAQATSVTIRASSTILCLDLFSFWIALVKQRAFLSGYDPTHLRNDSCWSRRSGADVFPDEAQG